MWNWQGAWLQIPVFLLRAVWPWATSCISGTDSRPDHNCWCLSCQIALAFASTLAQISTASIYTSLLKGCPWDSRTQLVNVRWRARISYGEKPLTNPDRCRAANNQPPCLIKGTIHGTCFALFFRVPQKRSSSYLPQNQHAAVNGCLPLPDVACALAPLLKLFALEILSQDLPPLD